MDKRAHSLALSPHKVVENSYKKLKVSISPKKENYENSLSLRGEIHDQLDGLCFDDDDMV